MPDVDELATIARGRIGKVLREKWQLDALLGVGGMAAVYSATHRNGNRAAIKLLHAHIRVGSEAMSRFLREGRVANQVQHPGAVAVLDDDVDEDGAIFVVMELLEGETLGQLVDRKAASGGVPLADLLRVIDEVLDVLAAAHENGVVHRDLKPDNVFVLADGSAKILDFGIARLREASKGKGETTAEGMLMGTPEFMPPEQSRGDWDHVDGQSDVWAVGATMFSVLARRPVHQAKTMSAQLVLSGTTPAPSLASVTTDVPADVCALVDRALAFDKADRWPDARSMQRQLQTIREGLSAPRRPITLGSMSARARLENAASPVDDEPRPKKKSNVALVVLGLGVVAFGVFAWRSPQLQQRLRGGLQEPAAENPSSAATPLTSAPLVSTRSGAAPEAGTPNVADRTPPTTPTTPTTPRVPPTVRPTSPAMHTAAPATTPNRDWLPAPTVSAPPAVSSAHVEPPPPEELFLDRK
ncbi:MAG: serine/threonine protein kinase [Myxococcaceae bacterium]|nr:serine/threonine protein kinase [Myxococcaceae bacterium]